MSQVQRVVALDLPKQAGHCVVHAIPLGSSYRGSQIGPFAKLVLQRHAFAVDLEHGQEFFGGTQERVRRSRNAQCVDFVEQRVVAVSAHSTNRSRECRRSRFAAYRAHVEIARHQHRLDLGPCSVQVLRGCRRLEPGHGEGVQVVKPICQVAVLQHHGHQRLGQRSDVGDARKPGRHGMEPYSVLGADFEQAGLLCLGDDNFVAAVQRGEHGAAHYFSTIAGTLDLQRCTRNRRAGGRSASEGHAPRRRCVRPRSAATTRQRQHCCGKQSGKGQMVHACSTGPAYSMRGDYRASSHPTLPEPMSRQRLAAETRLFLMEETAAQSA